MYMMNQRLPYLLNQYLNKSCSTEELAEFYVLVNDPINELEFNDLIEDAILNTDAEQHLDSGKKTEVLKHVFSHREHPVILKELPLKNRKDWKTLVAIAALLIMISAVGIYFVNVKLPFGLNEKTAIAVNHKSVITPGGNKAVLTLSSGNVINLEELKDGKVADEGDVTVTKNQSGQLTYLFNAVAAGKNIKKRLFNTLTTPRGGQYQLNLPDGSKVWLNAASSLKFPSTFSGLSQRKVELSGEAYFEIAKNQGVPFVVVSNKQEVEVLGTHFNINAYTDESDTRTVLLEGSVKVTDLLDRKDVLLKPGQEAVLGLSAIKVQEADLDKAIDWKSGKFIFKNESLESIMRKVARWYDVEIIYMGHVPKQETFSGTVSRFDNVEKVLRRLELTGEVSFKIDGRKITVLK